MEEELIKYDTAVLSKEKGFDIVLERRFYFNSELTTTTPSQSSKPIVYAPTQGLLQKWLREVHNTLIEVTPVDSLDSWSYTIICKDIMGGFFQIQTIEEEFKTYEDALEKGLQGALNSIKCKD